MKYAHQILYIFIGITLTACGGGGSDDADCSDFAYQQDAQAWHNSNPGSDLDADNDGIACEHLPRR
jgi:hypothetical protein